MRFKIELPADMGREEIEKAVLEDARSEKWTGGTKPLKMVVVPGKIVNVVVKPS
jgi:leucyl-tRNA synthetase